MWKIASAFTLLIVLAASAFAQAPTLRIVTDDPTLPSELFYGNVKVKPLRLRPGTNVQITINDSDFFVTQQYVDFLSRFPEQSGFDAWLGYLNGQQTSCATTPDPGQCMRDARADVSAGFFKSNEFNLKGGYVFRFYRASFGEAFTSLPNYQNMVDGMRSVTGSTAAEVDQKRALFATNWVLRTDFLDNANFPRSLTPTEFVNRLVQRAGITNLSNGATIINDLQAAGNTDAARAVALRAVVDSAEVQARQNAPSFVYMQYVGYLRRAPEQGGFDAWLSVFRNNPNDDLANTRIMVNGFIDSSEYKNRF